MDGAVHQSGMPGSRTLAAHRRRPFGPLQQLRRSAAQCPSAARPASAFAPAPAEALHRRVVQGKGLPLINNVVDIINLVSVESLLPLGLYDLEKVREPIVFRAGRAGETYKGIGKYDLNLEGLPVFCDALGPFGSPTSDSERTMVTAAAKKILLVIISFGGREGIERWTVRAMDLLKRYADGSELQSRIVE